MTTLVLNEWRTIATGTWATATPTTWTYRAMLVSQSTSANTSRVRVQLYHTASGLSSYGRYYSATGCSTIGSTTDTSTLYNWYTAETVLDQYITLTHNSSGVYSATWSARAMTPGMGFDVTMSGNCTIPTIARASVPSVADFNIGSTMTIKMNRKSTNFTHTVSITYGSTAVQVGTNVEESVTYNTASIADALYQLCPNSPYYEGTVTVITYNGSETIGTATSTWHAYANVTPTISSAAYADTNSTTTAVTGDDQMIVQNMSHLTFTVTATANQYASLASAYVVINGTTHTGSFSGSTATISCEEVNLSSTTSIAVIVADSRGKTASQTVSVTAYAYAAPTATVTAVREQGYYSNTAITANATYSSIGGTNVLTLTAYASQSGTAAYTQLGPLTNYTATTYSLDNTYAWRIRVNVADSFNTVYYYADVAIGIPISFWDRVKRSFSMNQFPTHNNSVEITGSLYVNDKPILVENSWTALTLASGVSTSSAGTGLEITPAYKVVGNEIHLRGHIAFTAGSDVTICTLPEEARPTAGAVFWFAPLTGANIARCKITTAGAFTVEWVRDIASGTASTASITWLDISHIYSID